MIAPYTEPLLTVAVLDYRKPIESRLLLESIKRHVKVPHKVVFCDNGSGEDYALQFVKEGLVDQLIVNRESLGLGIGTRDLINAVQSEYVAYVQNDQIFERDLTEDHFHSMAFALRAGTVQSITLAGMPCGQGVFSERAAIYKTSFYKSLEPLSFGGAGPWHEYPWREGQIQQIYRDVGYVHAKGPFIVQDNGVFAVRDMKDGGLWCHRTDTKALFCITRPTTLNPVYPKFDAADAALALSPEGWPDGKVPSVEIKDSFDCWSPTLLGRMQDDYIKDLRRRVKETTS